MIEHEDRQTLHELSKHINTFQLIVECLDTRTDASPDYLVGFREQILSLLSVNIACEHVSVLRCIT